jgi:hypothetical protein
MPGIRLSEKMIYRLTNLGLFMGLVIGLLFILLSNATGSTKWIAFAILGIGFVVSLALNSEE